MAVTEAAIPRPCNDDVLRMERVIVLGCGGAGKSTLARKLSQLTGLPVIGLDAHFWNPGWIETPADQWRERVRELSSRDQWIMEGNYAKTLDLRLPRADTVIFLDMPRRLCLWRVFKRRVQYFGRTRPDMAPGCKEKIDWEFLLWIWRFRQSTRPQLLEALALAQRQGKRVHHLISRRQVRGFMKSLRNIAR